MGLPPSSSGVSHVKSAVVAVNDPTFKFFGEDGLPVVKYEAPEVEKTGIIEKFQTDKDHIIYKIVRTNKQ